MEVINDRVAGVLAQLTGREVERVRADMAVSAMLDAAGARTYGLIDHIVESPILRGH